MDYLGNIGRTVHLFADSIDKTIQSPFSTRQQPIRGASPRSSVTAFHVSNSVSSCITEAGSSISTAIDEIVKIGDETITDIKRYMFINTGERQRNRNRRRLLYRQRYSTQVSVNDAFNDRSHTTDHRIARTVDNAVHKLDAKPNSLTEQSPISACLNKISIIKMSPCDDTEHQLVDHLISSSQEMYDIVGRIDAAIEYCVTSQELKVTIECATSNKKRNGKQNSKPMFVKVCIMPQNVRKHNHTKKMKGNKLLNEVIYIQDVLLDSARFICLRFQLCKKMCFFARKRHTCVGETFVWIRPKDLDQRVKVSKYLHMQ